MYRIQDLESGTSVERIYDSYKQNKSPFSLRGKKRVNILALGDVGKVVLMGLKLRGEDVIDSIGIFDIDTDVMRRMEMEMNQVFEPWDYDNIPHVEMIKKEELFDGDVFVFCASVGVPHVKEKVQDVRMVQFSENRKLIRMFARLARDANFKGLFAVVSDPVDPLCKEVLIESNRNQQGEVDGKGLGAEQIQGFGLGVMNARAAYYAKKYKRFESFLTEGRAFGPHGHDLVIANSIANYDDEISTELTKLAAESNLKAREIGFKPFMAPALSSGALSILRTLRGEWHYSSNLLGDVFMGAKNRMTEAGIEWEDLELPPMLFSRISHAYKNLQEINYEYE